MKKWMFLGLMAASTCWISCTSDTSQSADSTPKTEVQQIAKADSLNAKLQTVSKEIDTQMKDLNKTELELNKAFELQ